MVMHVQVGVGGPRVNSQSPQGHRAGMTGPLSLHFNGFSGASRSSCSVPCASLRQPVVSHIFFGPKPVTLRLYRVYVAD